MTKQILNNLTHFGTASDMVAQFPRAYVIPQEGIYPTQAGVCAVLLETVSNGQCLMLWRDSVRSSPERIASDFMGILLNNGIVANTKEIYRSIRRWPCCSIAEYRQTIAS
jgi:hypothetical protein